MFNLRDDEETKKDSPKKVLGSPEPPNLPQGSLGWEKAYIGTGLNPGP